MSKTNHLEYKGGGGIIPVRQAISPLWFRYEPGRALYPQ